jgi:hypothetical protein
MTSKEHLEVSLKLWYSTVKELEKMNDFLTVEKINDQFYRRLFLRNIFSIIETYIFVTKELVKNRLVIDKEANQVSWADLAALNEKKVVLDTQGKVEIKDDFQKFEPSLRFTLNIFAKVFESSLPNYGDSNFEKLKRLSKRRNDITHPKSLNELVISDEEVKEAISMFTWFIQTHGQINGKFLEWANLTYGKPE